MVFYMYVNVVQCGCCLVVWHFLLLILILINLHLHFLFYSPLPVPDIPVSSWFCSSRLLTLLPLLSIESLECDLCCFKYVSYIHFTSFAIVIIYLCSERSWYTGCQPLAIWVLGQKRSCKSAIVVMPITGLLWLTVWIIIS